MRTKSFLLFTLALLASAPALHAHGGTYVGPGDVTPPGGGPPAGTPPPPPGQPPQPITPAGPTLPGTPSLPGQPTTPAPDGPRGSTPVTGASALPASDGSDWQFWWELNKHRYLHLRSKIHGADPATESGSLSELLGLGADPARAHAPSEQEIVHSVLPALLVAAEDSDRDLRSGALIALARLGREDERVTARFRAALAAPLQEIAETSALAYGILGAPAALDEVLVPLAWDTETGRQLTGRAAVPMRTRAFAAYAMARLGARATAPELQEKVMNQLLGLLEQDRSAAADLRVAAAVGLGILRPADPAPAGAAWARLKALLEAGHDDPIVLAHLRTASAKLLLGLPAGERALRDQVLAATLPLLGPRSTADALQQESVAIALGLLARPDDPRSADIFDALRWAAAEAKDVLTRRFSLMALADLGAADPAFDSPARRMPVTRCLLTHLKRGRGGLEAWAGLALGVLAFERAERGATLAPEAVNELREAFRTSGAGWVRGAFAIALGLAGDPEATPLMASALHGGSDPEFLGYCAVALGMLRAHEEAPTLVELMERHRRDPALLQQAAIGLGLMRHRAALERLIEWLHPASGRPTLAVLAATATGIGLIGDARAVAPLIQALQDPRRLPLSRAFAAVALGLVGDRDLIPWNAPFGADLNYRATLPTLVDRSLATGILDLL